MPPRYYEPSDEVDFGFTSNIISKAQKRPRKVTFSQTVKVKQIDHVKDLEQSTVEKIWFSKADLAEIKQACVATIQLVLDGDIVDEDDGMCIRGLEKRIWESAAAESKLAKQKARAAVFDEQNLQREVESYDPEWIARQYGEASRASKTMAYRKGIEDEMDLTLLDR